MSSTVTFMTAGATITASAIKYMAIAGLSLTKVAR
jgi:hypothetical protein